MLHAANVVWFQCIMLDSSLFQDLLKIDKKSFSLRLVDQWPRAVRVSAHVRAKISAAARHVTVCP